MMLLEHFPSRETFAKRLDSATVVPLGVKILADTETPVSVLSRFENASPNLFLLESAEGGETFGRYSFIGLSARAVITIYRDDVVIRQGIAEQRIAHGNDPLAVLRERMAPYTIARDADFPRFCGGLVGYFAYEMAHFFEPRVPNTLPPERPLAELMIPDALMIFDNVAHTLTAFALAFREDGDADALYDRAREKIDALLRTLEKPLATPLIANPTPLAPPRPVHAPDYYKDMVRAVKRHIYEGDVIQCVVSESFVGAAPDDPVALYRTQRYVNPSPYLYFFKFRGCTLIGSSPETMIRLNHRTACLRPIAGTRPRGATEQHDRALTDALLNDEKERAEHLMLVDLGRNELGRVSRPGTVQVTDLMLVEKYSHVMHLVSNIVSELEPRFDMFDLFRSAFPAGTLSGAPKVRAMQLVAALEADPRGPYGGAAGYFSFDGNMDFAICIRTAVLEHGRLTLRAGAGIVADSDPETEYDEILNKAKAMSRAIAMLAPAAQR